MGHFTEDVAEPAAPRIAEYGAQDEDTGHFRKFSCCSGDSCVRALGCRVVNGLKRASWAS